MVNLLLAVKEFQMKRPNKLGQSAVHTAALANTPKITAILLKHDFPCTQDVNKMHPAHFAAQIGGLETLKAILVS